MKPKQNPTAGVPIMDAEAIRKALRRIAHEIIEGNPNLESVVLAGYSVAGRGNRKPNRGFHSRDR